MVEFGRTSVILIGDAPATIESQGIGLTIPGVG